MEAAKKEKSFQTWIWEENFQYPNFYLEHVNLTFHVQHLAFRWTEKPIWLFKSKLP